VTSFRTIRTFICTPEITMRYVLMFVGAAVVTYFLTIGIRAFMAEQRAKSAHPKPNTPTEDKTP